MNNPTKNLVLLPSSPRRYTGRGVRLTTSI